MSPPASIHNKRDRSPSDPPQNTRANRAKLAKRINEAVILFTILFILLCIPQKSFAFSPDAQPCFPTGGQRGTDLKLTILGNRLCKAKTLLFYQKGIQVAAPQTVEDKKVVFPIRIAPNAPCGEYLYRVVCDDGISHLRSFWVGAYPTINEEKKANDSIKQAQSISLNQTIAGLTKNEDQDYYKIHLNKDQIISLELQGMQLGRTFYDPYLAILDRDGRELMSSDDSVKTKQDPRISFKAPQQSDYFILVRESSYQGNNNCHYRLHVGDFVFARSIYPLGAMKGKELHFAVRTEHEGIITKKAIFQQSHDTTKNFPNITPNRIPPSPFHTRVKDFGFIQEKEPNHHFQSNNQNHIPQLPIGFHGTIDTPNDIDWFKFHAKKGQRIRAQVYARSLGSPIDTALHLHDSKVKFLAYNDDASQGNADSKIEFNIPVDGIYGITVRDHLKNHSPHHHYRLEVTTVEPKITATIANKSVQNTQEWKAFSIPRGNKAAYAITIAKSNYKGDVKLHLPKLPKGIKVRQLIQAKNDNKALLYLEAEPNAPLTANLYPIYAHSPDNKLKTLVKAKVHPFLGQGNRVYHAYQTEHTAIAVTSPVAATVELLQPSQPIVQSGNISIPVKVHKQAGFDQDIHIEIPWKPQGISANYSLKIPKGKTDATIQLAADGNAALGNWDFCIRAIYHTKGKVEICSNIIKLNIAPPFISAKLEMAATNQGEATNILCKINHKKAFQGNTQLTLHGLPDGIKAKPVQINKTTKQISIPIEVPANARIGKHSNLFCRVNIPSNNQSIPHTIGQGGVLRVNPPAKTTNKKPSPKPNKKPPTSKPLSRLEQLRVENRK